MAEHAGPATGRLSTESTGPHRYPAWKASAAVCGAAFVALAAVGGWLGYEIVHHREVERRQDAFVEAARQGAVNLTTIDHRTVDTDIQRVLDTSTGAFHDDFRKRSGPFAEVVRRAQSTSEGTVTEDALIDSEDDRAEVLVLVSVRMSTPGAAEQDPQVWRMKVAVEQADGTPKISDVQFVS